MSSGAINFLWLSKRSLHRKPCWASPRVVNGHNELRWLSTFQPLLATNKRLDEQKHQHHHSGKASLCFHQDLLVSTSYTCQQLWHLSVQYKPCVFCRTQNHRTRPPSSALPNPAQTLPFCLHAGASQFSLLRNSKTHFGGACSWFQYQYL